VRELHRVLAGGPLPGVVQTHEQEDRLAVSRLHVAGDLDAGDLAALDGRLGQGQGLDQPRVAGCEVGQLLLVVGEGAVAGAAARQRRARHARGVRGVELRALTVPRDEVGHLDGPVEAGRPQDLEVGDAVQHDLDESSPACSVRSRPRPLSRSLSARVGVSTRTRLTVSASAVTPATVPEVSGRRPGGGAGPGHRRRG
jgi:hypothetical protein